MILNIHYKSKRNSAIASELKELEKFIQDQTKRGEQVDLRDWKTFEGRFGQWRRRQHG
ncbi:hypothetical protein MJA45_10365 [Paenibacillus aurantius]|uniref:Uncharacterized protein n=1 Tax=Paenibacillus aurantius TaxID=2918900 RepID=A0AA96LI37_9BACL|nr:hypothetical protein [Paenibacillus aurantius]WJH32980.1 hypothetical protein N6H14_22520 [Paenibacillus sp. CC-CFT747]WNQ13398.1 hypothetical protein MJA45_10365 [Paenibacillus aurantius]